MQNISRFSLLLFLFAPNYSNLQRCALNQASKARMHKLAERAAGIRRVGMRPIVRSKFAPHCRTGTERVPNAPPSTYLYQRETESRHVLASAFHSLVCLPSSLSLSFSISFCCHVMFIFPNAVIWILPGDEGALPWRWLSQPGWRPALEGRGPNGTGIRGGHQLQRLSGRNDGETWQEWRNIYTLRDAWFGRRQWANQPGPRD